MESTIPPAPIKDVKEQIRELFQQVPEAHRAQVLEALRPRTNEQRIQYLQGWLRAA